MAYGQLFRRNLAFATLVAACSGAISVLMLSSVTYVAAFLLPDEARAAESVGIKTKEYEFLTDIVDTSMENLQGRKLNDLDRPPKKIKYKKNGEIKKVQYHKVKVEYPKGTHRISSSFGDIRGRAYPHRGIDIRAGTGAPVIAAADGLASGVVLSEGGNTVAITHFTPSRYAEYKRSYKISTFYMHLDKILLPDSGSARVKRGQQIGTVGATGSLSGGTPHLHFQIRTANVHGNLNPGYFWAKGIGKITCYDPNASYPTDVTVLTWPLKCK